MIQENSIYLVGYSYGREEFYSEVVLFVTANEETAKAYVEKFNRVVTKYCEHVNERFFEACPDNNARRGWVNWNLLDSKSWYTKTKLK
jgi:hypothetical protein